MKRKLAFLTAFLALTGAVALAVTINSMTAIVTIDGDEEFEVWDPDQSAGNETRKMSLTQILGWLDDQAWTYTQAIAFSGGVSSDTWLLNETTAPSTAASQGALWIDASGILYQRAESDGASSQIAHSDDIHATTFVLTIDDVADSMDYSVAFVDAAFTITEIRAVHAGTGLSSPDIDIDIRHHTDRSNAGNQVETTAMAVTSSTTGDTWTSGFEDATVAADSWIWVETSSQSGTTDNLELLVIGTYD